MCEVLAHPAMSCGLALTDNGVRLIGKAAAVIKRTLDERPMPRAEAVNVLPRRRAAER